MSIVNERETRNDVAMLVPNHHMTMRIFCDMTKFFTNTCYKWSSVLARRCVHNFYIR